MMCVNVFYVVRNEISAGSNKNWEIFPKTPIVKIAHFCNVMTLPKWVILKWGSMGKFLVFCWIQLKIVSDYIKNVDTHPVSFSSKKPVIKYLYEMNSNFYFQIKKSISYKICKKSVSIKSFADIYKCIIWVSNRYEMMPSNFGKIFCIPC